MRWTAYALLTASLGAGVFMNGGVSPRQWEWCALGVAVATFLVLSERPERDSRLRRATFGLTVMSLLLSWMLFQLLPLPPWFIAHLSPQRWNAILAARQLTGQDPGAWVTVSLAPATTLQRLLAVLPAMATFLAAGRMAAWWPNRMWIVVAPVIGVAWLESVVGITQFSFVRSAGGRAGAVIGTYLNWDHFAGLLEMAFPLALMWAISVWRHSLNGRKQRTGPAFLAAILLAVSGCLLTGVIVSLSRMGFVATLISVASTMIMLAGSSAYRHEAGADRRRRLWLLPVALAVPILIAVFFPTGELLTRFADLAATKEVSEDTRAEIWKDTSKAMAQYKWTGMGLGAYERGLYRFKTVMPIRTLDFAHNDYLQILSELGIVGASLMALLALWVFWRVLAVALSPGTSSNWELAVGLLASLLAVGVHSLADFNLYIPANALAFAWLSGVAASPGLSKR